jgi:hypothetical protein
MEFFQIFDLLGDLGIGCGKEFDIFIGLLLEEFG